MSISRRFNSTSGVSLLETMISSVVAGAVLMAIVIGTATFQTVFSASDRYYRATANQMRVMDYVSRDLRRALTYTVAADNETLTLTLPDYIDPATKQPRTPTLFVGYRPFTQADGTATYGDPAAPIVVTYSRSGESIIRTEGTVPRVISNDIENFQIVPIALTNSARVSITFMPRFNRGNSADARAGTTVTSTVYLRSLIPI